MSSAPSSDVHWICPSCDAEPTSVPADGSCVECGSRLIEVRARAEDLTGVVVDGRFEIRGLLGQGGMGAVYRAWQRSVGREVAIKLIDERHGRDPMAVRRFLREARLASQLSQPNTVSVLDFGQSSDGRLFIAMELVRGRTLAEVLAAEGPFSAGRAAWIGVQLCDALDAAHRLQIVHRDLKPANVVLLDDPPGRDLIKVLDFGLAKSLAESETKATDTGLVVGTPRYMAPEVILGEPPTAQSDLYAVGVILGELASGKLMWDATSFPALAGQKLQGSPIIHELPLGLRGVVARMIDPDLARRPSSASEARALLRPVVTDSDGALTPVSDVSDGDGDGKRRAPTPSAPRPAAPPIDPTLPQVPGVTAPGTRAARRSSSEDGDRGGKGTPPPVTPLSPSAVLAAASLATAAVDSPRSTDRLEAVKLEGQGGRGKLLLGAAALAAVAAIAFILLGRGAKHPAGAGAGTDDPGAGSTDVVAPVIAVDGGASAAAATSVDAMVAEHEVDAGAAATPPRATVAVDVRSRPAGGDILVDGKVVGVTPMVVPIDRGTAPVTIDVRSSGLATRAQRITPDHDQSLTFTLVKRRRGDDMPF